MSFKNRKPNTFQSPAPTQPPAASPPPQDTSNDVQVVVMSHAADLPLPAYATAGAAGIDLRAAIDKETALMAGARMLVPTGIKLALPPGMEAQVRPRSGLALQDGVTVLNAPGTIDPDYRGEVMVLLINLGGKVHYIKRGDRIAQMVFSRFCEARLNTVDRLTDTERGENGFGSTGTL